MNVKDLRDKSEKELSKLLNELKDKLRELRFQLSVGQLKKIHEVSKVRKDIARILTVLNERKVNKDNNSENKN